MLKNYNFYNLTDQDFRKTLAEMAKESRGSTPILFRRDVALYPQIKRVYEEIKQRRRKGLDLISAERWLVDNFYLIKRELKKDIKDKLPSMNEEPRILKIARFIVANSLKNITIERIILALKAVEGVVNLTVKELRHFNTALSYALIEGVFVLSQRISYFRRMEREAQFSHIVMPNLKSDIYLHFAQKNDYLKGSLNTVTSNSGVDLDGVEAGFLTSVSLTDRIAEGVFDALLRLGELTPMSTMIDVLTATKILTKDSGFSNISEDTRLYYLSFVEKMAKKAHTTEKDVASKLIGFASIHRLDLADVIFWYNKSFLDYILFKPTDNRISKDCRLYKEYLYLVLPPLLALITSVVLGVFWTGVFAIFAFMPIIYLYDTVFLRLVPRLKEPCFVPRCNYTSIPEEGATMVVVPEYISSKEMLLEAIKHAKRLAISSGKVNVRVALLIDFKEALLETTAEDDEFLDIIKQYADGDVDFFVRKRVKYRDKYVARDRKRGAIEDLNTMLITGDQKDFLYVKRAQFSPVFIYLLDHDNVIDQGGVLDALNVILHPFARSYDLCVPQAKYNLNNASTPFSYRLSLKEGYEIYPMYSTVFFDIFRKDVFCGKGLYRLKNYEKVLSQALPENKLLSHDLIEGGILNTMPAGVVYEDAPSNFSAYDKRASRWLKGDVQVLPVALTLKDKLSPLYFALILKNALKPLSDISLFVAYVLGTILSPTLLFIALSITFIPFLIDLMIETRAVVEGKRIRYFAKDVLGSFLMHLRGVLMLPYYALKNGLVFLSTVKDILTNTNLTKWVTFAETKEEDNWNIFIPSMILLVGVLIGLFFVGLGEFLAFSIYFLLVMAEYMHLIASSITPVKKPLTKEDTDFLLDIADRTYGYFQMLKNDDLLTPDNYQFDPKIGASKHTSPTDLGCELLAQVSALELGIIYEENAFQNIEKSLKKIVKLTKWKGHLYNWYSTDGKILDRFVSSVDSGNFIASLIVVKECARCYKRPNLVQISQKLIDNTRLDALYDPNKKLFYLGYNTKTKKYSGHYDLLASESRLLSYIYAAYYGMVDNYNALIRDYSPVYGNTLLSWSGTMFEYLLPSIFIDAPKGSAIFDTERNAVATQNRNKVGGVWGRSECGKYEFDDSGRYQYYAYGEETLSLRGEDNSAVIAPYASILALNVGSRAIKNMRRLIAKKMVNKTGFFESIDMTQSANVIYSQMTHHQGMIIASICNVLKGDRIKRLFMQDPKIAAADTLLTELTPKIRYGKKNAKKQPKLQLFKSEYFENQSKIEYLSRVFSSTNGEISLLSDRSYNNKVFYKGKALSLEPSPYENTFGGVFLVKSDSKVFAPTKAPLYQKKNYRTAITDGGILYTNDTNGCQLFVKKCDAFSARYTRLTIDRDNGHTSQFAFYEKVTLADADQYASHSVYSDMMVSSEFLQDYNTVVFTRRDPQNGSPLYCAYVVKGLDDVVFSTNREKVFGRYNDAVKSDFFRDEIDFSSSFGDVLNPCMFCKGTFTARDEKGCVEIITLFAEDKEKLIENVAKIYDTDQRFYQYSYDVERIDDAFSAAFFAYFANLPSRNAKNSTILYQGLVDKYKKITQCKPSVLYKVQSRLNSLKRLIEVVGLARTFGLDVNIIVYVDPDSTLKYADVSSCFDGKGVSRYIATGDNNLEELRLFSVLELDESLSIPLKSIAIKPEQRQKIIETSHKVSRDDLDFVLAKGGFREDGDYIVTDATDLPYSNVVALKKGGFIATENGGGYTYFFNSREGKVGEFYSQYLKDEPAEKVFVDCDKTRYRVNKGGVNGGFTRVSRGEIEYFNQFDDFSALVKQFMIEDGIVKIIAVDLESRRGGKLSYALRPSLYWQPKKEQLAISGSGDTVVVSNLENGTCVYIRAIGDGVTNVKHNLDVDSLSLTVDVKEGAPTVYFAVSCDENAVLSLTPTDIIAKRHDVLAYFDSLNNVKIKTKDRGLDVLFNKYLVYQTLSSRLNGKFGYYQVGGATGFRDQLQDAVSLRQTDPNILREQILASASHQYLEGDVQHWWHEPYFGIRTKISDDKIFLPYAVAEYIQTTGDVSILDEKRPYLISTPLKAKEYSRVEVPQVSQELGTVKEHCFRAIKSAMRLGEHGLVVMGNGDWNDGLDTVCKDGKGESVVSTLMLIIAIDNLKPYLDDKHRLALYSMSNQLKKAVNQHAFAGGVYARLFRDDGRREGTPCDSAIKIDLVAQALAVLSGVAEDDRATSAIKACEKLIDYPTKTVSLLYPAQSMDDYLGYISAYPKGVRENGGQYTHAAIWYVFSLLKLGKYDMAYEIASYFNPIKRYLDPTTQDKYLGEPYVMAGDIYTSGRMGWSWYTGSAGWYYRLILEGFFCITREGQYLNISPRLPKALDGSIVEYKFSSSVYTIKFVNSGVKRISFDGTPLEDTKKIPLIIDKKIAILVEF